MSLLEVQQVSKRYERGARPAVHDVSLVVQPGEFVSLVGESGSGKTTLLRLIAGLETADAGTIKLGERVISGAGLHVVPERRGVGLVFQHHALFPHLTVGQNVGFGISKMAKAERVKVVEGLLELIGLAGYGRRYPHELSGGERQRVALARALATNPGVMLLDEPFSSLDPLLRESLRDETRRVLRACGATAILVTHHTRDALAVSDRIVVMHNGLLEQMGTPDEVYHRPVNGYVASLFGPCNFMARAGAGAEGWVRPDELELVPVERVGGYRMAGIVSQVTYGGGCQDVTLVCEGGGELKVCHQGDWVVKEGETWGAALKG
ncbi:ABC transporter ATP-binding protein [Phragmitibacter flavus]|uniref:ABC transporter ATP-binding protein n=1 Tax=Phragmitibacter flavus TaxID=2576071 RepID=A0A5R8KB73_9BACT|nr:ABC transporter ATP-binding protein [Phragmitibacter flavus]TLD69564.1 ABC transporter ATP-binding protein [Phragmitibacter flavus]